MQLEDPYAVLNVERTAASSEIKKAFYKLSLQYHPDKHQDYKKEYTEIIQRITAAYDILSDPDKRKSYDLSSINNSVKIFAEVIGKVDYVNHKHKSRGALFSIYAEASKKRFRCIYDGFLPIKEGD